MGQSESPDRRGTALGGLESGHLEPGVTQQATRPSRIRTRDRTAGMGPGRLDTEGAALGAAKANPQTDRYGPWLGDEGIGIGWSHPAGRLRRCVDDAEAGRYGLGRNLRYDSIAPGRGELQVNVQGERYALVTSRREPWWSPQFKVCLHPHNVIATIFGLDTKNEVMRPVRVGPWNQHARGYSKVGNRGWSVPSHCPSEISPPASHEVHEAIANLGVVRQRNELDRGHGLSPPRLSVSYWRILL